MRPTPQRAGERSRHFVLAVHTARHTVSVGDVQGHKLFGNRDTAGVPARRTRCLGGALCGKSLLGQRAGGRQAQQRQDQCHTHIHAVLRLLKIGGARVVVNRQRDLIYAGQRVQHRHVRFAQRH